MKLAATGSSVIGPGHITDKLPNQDALLVRGILKGWSISIADGLGSRPLSHIGSRYCTQVFRQTVKQIAERQQHPLAICRQVQQSWLDYFGKEFTAFETTCLWAWVSERGKAQAAQVGDGLLLIKSQGKFKTLTPAREGFCNQTQTLARAKSHDWVTAEFALTQPGDGVLLMTDGISDDLIPEQLEGFFDTIFLQLKKSNKRRCKKWLNQELNQWSTPKHSDDKTIAGIFRIE